MFRYSLTTFFVFVLTVSVGAAALARPTARWSEIVVTMTVIVLMVASLAAILWRRRARAYVGGFAFCGWAYLVLVFVSDLGLRDELLTDDAVSWLYSTMHERQQPELPALSITSDGRVLFGVGVDSEAGVTGTLMLDEVQGRFVDVRTYYRRQDAARAERRNFSHIAHALCALLIACVGGVMGRFLYAIDRPRNRAKKSNVARGEGLSPKPPDSTDFGV